MLTIISGGQAGVDLATLDVTIELGIGYCGWCPRGGFAEDMPDPPGLVAEYPGLRETPDADPRLRTRVSWGALGE
jgi:putative molybdenum carrier protein